MTTSVPPFYYGTVQEVLSEVAENLPSDAIFVTLRLSKTDVPGWYHIQRGFSAPRHRGGRR